MPNALLTQESVATRSHASRLFLYRLESDEPSNPKDVLPQRTTLTLSGRLNEAFAQPGHNVKHSLLDIERTDGFLFSGGQR